jgi:hypothetical protein
MIVAHNFKNITLRHLALILIIFFGLSQTASPENISSTHTILSDTIRLKSDLKIITKTANSRNYRNIQTLNFVADYIFNELSKNCDTVYYQSYYVNGVEYKNVIGSIGIDKQERIVIGAHYDVCGDQEGADDNASGVAGVLELSRLLSKEKLSSRIDFVAYSLEEPPFFRTEHMGSNIHAKMLSENQAKLKGMICLEMIGYFNDKPKSQSYPIGFLSLFYGNKGDYITIVQKFGNGTFGSQVNKLMKKQRLIRTKSFIAPSKLPGVDFSDHQNYWKYGYSAVMITNTAFYRNRNYHEKTDKMETLDLKRMALVIDEVLLTIRKLK